MYRYEDKHIQVVLHFFYEFCSFNQCLNLNMESNTSTAYPSGSLAVTPVLNGVRVA